MNLNTSALLILALAGRPESLRSPAIAMIRILVPTKVGPSHWESAPTDLKRVKIMRDDAGNFQVIRLIEFR